MPVPMMNVINGGAHANNNLDIQDAPREQHGDLLLEAFPDEGDRGDVGAGRAMLDGPVVIPELEFTRPVILQVGDKVGEPPVELIGATTSIMFEGYDPEFVVHGLSIQLLHQFGEGRDHAREEPLQSGEPGSQSHSDISELHPVLGLPQDGDPGETAHADYGED